MPESADCIKVLAVDTGAATPNEFPMQHFCVIQRGGRRRSSWLRRATEARTIFERLVKEGRAKVEE